MKSNNLTSKFNTFVNNIKGQRVITSIVSILLLVGLMMGFSYAIFEYQNNKSIDNLLTTRVGDLTMTFSSKTNTVSMENAQPMSDAYGLAQTPYTFTITNTGSNSLLFNVKLREFYYDTTTHDDSDLHFPEDKLKVNINDGTNSTTKYITGDDQLASGVIEGGATKTYSVRIWIDESAGNEVIGKHYHGRIELISATSGDEQTQSLNMVIRTNLEDHIYENEFYNDQIFISEVEYGSPVHNYLWYSGKLWRIYALDVNKGNTTAIKAITEENMVSISRNGPEAGSGGDYSTFLNSYAYQWLNEDFYETLRNPEQFLVTNYNWNASLITPDTWNYITYFQSYDIPRTDIVTAPVGLMTLYELYFATSKSYYIYSSYLKNTYRFQMINPASSNEIWIINVYGDIEAFDLFFKFPPLLRPVVSFKPNLEVVGGTGTETDPYRLAGDNDKEENLVGASLNSRYSGEYVKLGNVLARIVKVEDDLTKIVTYNDHNYSCIFSTFSNLFGDDFDESTCARFLNSNTDSSSWYKQLSNNAKDMIEDATWYLGAVGDYENYKKSLCVNVSRSTLTNNCTKTSVKTTQKVGLLRYGEIFATQIMPAYSTNDIFLITPTPNGAVQAITYNGFNYIEAKENGLYVKPSVYLKSNVIIVSGDGTKENPFIITM